MTERPSDGDAAEPRSAQQPPEPTPTAAQKKPLIVVTGDVCLDMFGLERPPRQVLAETSNWKLAGETITNYRRGGAWAPAEMIREATKHSAEVLAPVITKKPWGGVGPIPPDDLARLKPDDVVHSFLVVGEYFQNRPKGKDDKPPKVYRIKEFHGFAGRQDGAPTSLGLKIENDWPDADIVVCDDAGNGFRNRPEDWPAAI